MTTVTTDLRPGRDAARTAVSSALPSDLRPVVVACLEAAAAVLAAFAAALTPAHAVVAAAGWVCLLRLVDRGSARRTAHIRAGAGPFGSGRGGIRAVLHTTVAAGAAGWSLSTLPRFPASSTALLHFTVGSAILTVLVRAMSTERAAGASRVIVLGDDAALETAVAELITTASQQVMVVGQGAAAEASDLIRLTAPDAAVVLPGPGLSGRALQRLSWLLERQEVPMLLHLGLADTAPWRTAPVRVGRTSLVRVRAVRRRGLPILVKQAWERMAAAALLVVLSPALLLIALLVRLDSPGPAIFRQERVGRDGHTFTMLKFRTMCADAEQLLSGLEHASDGDGVLFKMRRDPRVTRVGHVLRRFSIDEVPQLLNVVRGEMALVGPRPALPREIDAGDADPHHRLVVAPGLTGLWQVSGRSDLSREDAVRLDLDYVDNWSLGRDLVILCQTVRAVLSGRGAY